MTVLTALSADKLKHRIVGNDQNITGSHVSFTRAQSLFPSFLLTQLIAWIRDYCTKSRPTLIDANIVVMGHQSQIQVIN
jgi:hypothetical protein